MTYMPSTIQLQEIVAEHRKRRLARDMVQKAVLGEVARRMRRKSSRDLTYRALRDLADHPGEPG